MIRVDVSKVLFILVNTILILGLAFGFGLYSGVKKNVVYQVINKIKATVEGDLKAVNEEAPALTRLKPTHHLQKAQHKGTGVTVNETRGGERDLILLSGFFMNTNELRLIRRSGEMVARWPVEFSALFPDTSHITKPPATDWNTDTHGALILPNGSVVFNFDYHGLVKLDRCGAPVWTLPLMTHHSVERAEGGGFWVPGRYYVAKESDSSFPPFKTPYNVDTILKVSENGEVLVDLSVPKILYDNGLEALLTASGQSIAKNTDTGLEIIHLNKIEELTSDLANEFPMFETGDLALSLRNRNLVLVVDPDTQKVRWWKVGPWLRQHDPEFRPGGKIIVFNNNNYRVAYKDYPDALPIADSRLSNILEVQLASNEPRVIYGGTPEQRMFSIIRSKLEPTPAGGLLITEFQAGRAFEIDEDGRVVWQYINRYSDTEVGELTEARAYGPDYFEVTDWSCQT